MRWLIYIVRRSSIPNSVQVSFKPNQRLLLWLPSANQPSTPSHISQPDDLALAQKLEIDDLANGVSLALLTYVVPDVDSRGKIGDENGSRPIVFADSFLGESDFLDEICVVWVVIWCGAVIRQELPKDWVGQFLIPPEIDLGVCPS